MSESTALKEFKNSLQIADELIRIERNNYHNPPKQNEQKAVEGLRGGASVIMVAAFEHFIRQIIEEHLSYLTMQPFKVKFDELPDKMKIHSVFKTLEYATKGRPFEERKDKMDRLSDIYEACRLILSGCVNPEVFSSDIGNPNSKHVKDIMNNLGIDNIFAKIKDHFDSKWRNPTASTFISDKLDEIVNRRHTVAHKADA